MSDARTVDSGVETDANSLRSIIVTTARKHSKAFAFFCKTKQDEVFNFLSRRRGPPAVARSLSSVHSDRKSASECRLTNG